MGISPMATGFDYKGSAKRAEAALARVGVKAFLKVQSQTGLDYDPNVGPEKRFVVYLAVLDYKISEIDNARVLQTDKRVLMSVGKLTQAPTPDDVLEIGGVNYKIVGPQTGLGVKIIAPGGITVLYDIQARK